MINSCGIDEMDFFSSNMSQTHRCLFWSIDKIYVDPKNTNDQHSILNDRYVCINEGKITRNVHFMSQWNYKHTYFTV